MEEGPRSWNLELVTNFQQKLEPWQPGPHILETTAFPEHLSGECQETTMSLCCLPFFRGSRKEKVKREICVCGRRSTNEPHRRLPSISGRKTRMVTVGIPGKEYPSQAIKWVRAGKAHTSHSSSRVCVGWGGEGQHGMRERHRGQEQVGRYQKPGGFVMFMAQVMAHRKGS